MHHVKVATILAEINQVDDMGVAHPSEKARAFEETLRVSMLREVQLADNDLLPACALALQINASCR